MRLAPLQSIRRLLAGVLLLLWGAPAAAEWARHTADSGPLIHVEASTTRHHADNCALTGVAAEQISDLAWVPTLQTLADPVAVDVVGLDVRPSARCVTLPTSRSPPTNLG